jgi:predicted small lipoprotein YifL
VRLLTFILLTLWLAACGQSGALYFAQPDKPEQPTKQPIKQSAEQEKQEQESPSTDPTSGP